MGSIASTTRRPCCSAGRNGIGGAGITFAIVESSSGAASAAATNAAMTSGVAGRISSPPTTVVDLVQPELEAGRDPEVAAAATDRPEEVGMVLGVDVPELAVGRHDLGGEQVVDREAVLANEEPDAAAERDPADSDRAGVAEPGREAMARRRGRVLARGQTRLGPGRPALGIDLDRPQVAKVEHDPALGGAMAGRL